MSSEEEQQETTREEKMADSAQTEPQSVEVHAQSAAPPQSNQDGSPESEQRATPESAHSPEPEPLSEQESATDEASSPAAQGDAEELTQQAATDIRMEDFFGQQASPLPPQIEVGKVYTGKVSEVDDEHVYLNIGYKSDGELSIKEFAPDEIPQKGSELRAKVVAIRGSEDDRVILSHQQVVADELRSRVKEGSDIQGKITQKIKGGFTVSLARGIEGFVPFSLSGSRGEEGEQELVGQQLDFIVERVQQERKRLNIVLNRRAWLERQAQSRRDKFFAEKKVGDIVEGEVKNYTSFGAFIDLGGFDGLLHLNDMAWGHPSRPRDFVTKGEKIRVKIIALDQEKQRINFSLRELGEDPWFRFVETYHIDDIVAGQVTKLVDYGAFVALGSGIEGLVHISELSWIKRFKHPSEVLSVGQNVEVKILNIDEESRRVSLGMRQTMDNPWDTVEERYPVGTVLTLKVKNVISTGAFFELEEGIDGFLHVDDYSWAKRERNLTQVLQVGEELKVMVIEIDSHAGRIRLGVKQFSTNPWEELSKLGVGTVVEGEVVGKTDFGLFIRVQDGIDGLLHKHDLVESRQEDPEEALARYKEGDRVKAAIQDVDVDRQRLSLSIRSYIHNQQRREVEQYMHGDDDDHSTFSLGEMLNKGSRRED